MSSNRVGGRTLVMCAAAATVVSLYGAWFCHRAAEQSTAITSAQNVGARVEIAYSGPEWLDQIGAKRLRRYVAGLTFALSRNDLPQSDVLLCLTRFSRLRWLDLARVPFNDEEARCAARLNDLQILTFNNSSLTASGFAQLSALRSLQELNISGCRVDNSMIRGLAALPLLRSLSLRSASIADELVGLGRLRGLRRLDLADCRLAFEPSGARKLSNWLIQLDSLEELYLQDWPIQQGDVEALSRLRNLRVLNLTGCNVVSSELRWLVDLPKLEHLGLAPRVVDGDALQLFPKLGHLRVLSFHTGNNSFANSVSISSDDALRCALDLLGGANERIPNNTDGPLDRFLQTVLPKLRAALPSVQVNTTAPSYPGVRCDHGARVVQTPELVGED